MPWLLAADTLRSDGPDLEAPAQPAAANMHRITGAFTDPTHESAFTAQLFRMAYPTHILLMALVLAVLTWNALVQPYMYMRTYWAVLVVCVAVGLAFRVLLHRTRDPVQSQWMGSWAWTVLIALSFTVDMVSYIVLAPAATCAAFLQAKYMVPFGMLLLVLISGTHGLGFACKFALTALILSDGTLGISACHDSELDLSWIVCTMGVIVLGSATTHTAELYLRRSYAEKVLEQQGRSEDAEVALDIIYEAAAAATAELSAEVAAEVMWRTYFTHTFARRS